MLVPFNYIEEPHIDIQYRVIDDFNVMSQYAITNKEVLNLCGGVPSALIRQLCITIRSLYPGSLEVQAVCDSYELYRTLHFDAGFIDNNFLDVHRQQCGIGTNLRLNQVRAARNRQFYKLKTIAQLHNADDRQLIGYYCWGRLGYTMTHTDQAEFITWARKHKRLEKTLFTLLASASGRALWWQKGFEWLGEFMLHDSSINMQQLGQYVAGKGLAYVF